MNETISVLNNHRSIRSYTSEPVTEEQLDAIIKATQAAPTWGNGQQLSIVGVRDETKKEEIAQIIGQPWIKQAPVFLSFNLDFYRIKQTLEANGQSFVAGENVDTLLIGSTDVGIALGFAIAAAESMGLGIVPIGAIRTHSEKIINQLELPDHVFPVTGLVIGHPTDESAQKPRLPLESFYHEHTYNTNQAALINQYEQTFANYMNLRGNGATVKTWAETVARYYSHSKGIPQTSATLRNQGFNFK